MYTPSTGGVNNFFKGEVYVYPLHCWNLLWRNKCDNKQRNDNQTSPWGSNSLKHFQSINTFRYVLTDWLSDWPKCKNCYTVFKIAKALLFENNKYKIKIENTLRTRWDNIQVPPPPIKIMIRKTGIASEWSVPSVCRYVIDQAI